MLCPGHARTLDHRMGSPGILDKLRVLFHLLSSAPLAPWLLDPPVLPIIPAQPTLHFSLRLS